MTQCHYLHFVISSRFYSMTSKTSKPNDKIYCKSSFTLSFAIELLGIEVWHDCNEGWLDLGPCCQGFRVQYQLYPGQNYDIDILVWPHVAKVWCGTQFGWVRTWQFLERRWLTFSIRHAFSVRVNDLLLHTVTVSVTGGITALSSNAKSDQNAEVYIPPLRFSETRFFAPVEQGEQTLKSFIIDLIWLLVESYIPESFLDGTFDIPQPVTDVRHQDAILFQVRETVLNRNISSSVSEGTNTDPLTGKPRERSPKDKGKVEQKFEIKLSGPSILAGLGRLVPFESAGVRPVELGDIIVLISSTNLPASDDLPILFFNVDKLFNVPFEELSKARITHVFTQWRCGDEVHVSQPQPLTKKKREINFYDHYPLPLPNNIGSGIVATFMENPFEIELCGIREEILNDAVPKLFGYDRHDRDFNKTPQPLLYSPQIDVPIAICKINLQSLAKGINGLVRGEYPLHPLKSEIVYVARELYCTNAINAIRTNNKRNIVVPTSVILEAQMTLEVSIGLAGCKNPKLTNAYSRLFCMVRDTKVAKVILEFINAINEELVSIGEKNNVLTGWVVDTGDVALIIVEGPRDGRIISVWDLTGDYHPRVKTVFSTSAKYPSRLYAELLLAAVPFLVLKMYVPLSAVLVCPAVYSRPALPLPTRSAVMKLGRLIASGLRSAPCNGEMPTVVELRSFRLELCTPLRPVTIPSESAKLKYNPLYN